MTHPIRTLVLACGFGLGVGVMAMLLGVGEVILDQARSPAVSGGGDVVIASSTGDLPSSRWILSSALRTGGFEKRIAAASPSRRATLYLVKDATLQEVGSAFRRTVDTTPIRVTAGIPSLERAIGDPETSSIDSWTDAPSDTAWSSPDPGAALAALDRFHPIPNVPARADSWAEWLYFNGQAGDNKFYLTFMVGPSRPGPGTRRIAGVRLQLDRAGQRSSYSQAQDVSEAEILSSAPNLTIGSNSVRLEGMRYRITLDLPQEVVSGFPVRRSAQREGGSRTGARIAGELIIDASPGRALPPLEIRGAAGWVSGYVVPVMSGRLSGQLVLDGTPIVFNDGTGYHDHNWGFWKDVSWRWGQVHHGDLSFVYGRVHPPADAADRERIPGFLAAIGPDGPIGYATNVSIEEINDPVTGHPRTITVRARSSSLDVTMELAIDEALVTKRGGFFRNEMDFLQLRARYRVRGRAGERPIDFTASGAAETFRGQ
jgi:hypothetical protein